MIVRDYEGELLATLLLAPRLHIVDDPVTAEATTALRGRAQFLLAS